MGGRRWIETKETKGLVEPNCIVVGFAGEGAQGGWPKMDFVDGFMLRLKCSSSWWLKGPLFSGRRKGEWACPVFHF